MNTQIDGCGGRILLGDKTDEGAVTLRPIRFWCVEVCVPNGLRCWLPKTRNLRNGADK